MRNPGGYAQINTPEPTRVNFDRLWCEDVSAGVIEADTFTCVHCNSVKHVKARSQGDEYFCRNCMARICPKCADYPCIPFLKKLERQEARDRALRSYGV